MGPATVAGTNVTPETLIISDLHLSAERPRATEIFVRFARERAAAADALYIVGDLFDAWIGDDDDGALASTVREALRALTAQGVAVFFQGGNRDFLVGERFAAETGVRLIPELTVVDLYGTPTLLTHGDLLCTDDVDYQKARVMLRNPAFVADFLAKPLPARVALAAEYRRRSGEATSLKAEDIMDVTAGAVADAMRRHGVRRLIHGHTHRPALHTVTLDGEPAERVVLAEWHEDNGQCVSVSASGITVERSTP
jgi:UDP-2,3-diacylglucosamine hydrolase